MRTQLLTISLLCAGSLLAQSQTSSSGASRVNRPDDPLSSSSGSKSSDSNSSSPSSSPSYGSPSSYGSSSRFGATGRMGQHEIRASKLTSSSVKTSTGEDLGKIEDVIINPASGRVDFAVISYSGSSASGSSSSTTGTSSSSAGSSQSTPGSTTGSITTTSGSEKLVAIPWQLIRPSGALGYGSSASTSSSSEEMSFVFTGDKSKLEGAPSFSQNNWPDLTQPSWRQSVFSYFGVQPGSATGGSFSPGGSSSGSSTSPGSSSSSSSDSSQTPDSSTSRKNP